MTRGGGPVTKRRDQIGVSENKPKFFCPSLRTMIGLKGILNVSEPYPLLATKKLSLSLRVIISTLLQRCFCIYRSLTIQAHFWWSVLMS